jgi:hypothetical protein
MEIILIDGPVTVFGYRFCIVDHGPPEIRNEAIHVVYRLGWRNCWSPKKDSARSEERFDIVGYRAEPLPDDLCYAAFAAEPRERRFHSKSSSPAASFPTTQPVTIFR